MNQPWLSVQSRPATLPFFQPGNCSNTPPRAVHASNNSHYRLLVASSRHAAYTPEQQPLLHCCPFLELCVTIVNCPFELIQAWCEVMRLAHCPLVTSFSSSWVRKDNSGQIDEVVPVCAFSWSGLLLSLLPKSRCQPNNSPVSLFFWTFSPPGSMSSARRTPPYWLCSKNTPKWSNLLQPHRASTLFGEPMPLASQRTLILGQPSLRVQSVSLPQHSTGQGESLFSRRTPEFRCAAEAPEFNFSAEIRHGFGRSSVSLEREGIRTYNTYDSLPTETSSLSSNY